MTTVKSTEKILIIDDSESNRYFLSHHLSAAGYSIMEASKGIEGLEKLKEIPDLIILDVNLPDSSGYEICKTIKQTSSYKHIPIIQISASFTEAMDHYRGIESGADAYLVSPIEPLVLISTVKAWLRVRTSDKLLKASIDLLEQEKELRENFVSHLTHDLQTPLTAAKLSAQILIKGLSDNPTLLNVANRIIKNINRTDLMIRDLLDSNRVNAGENLALRIEYFHLNKVLQEIMTELNTIHGDVFDFIAGNTIDGYWDRNAIRRITENLCNNAVKYGDKTSKIKVTLQEQKDEVVLEVLNFGNPIKEEELTTLFSPYKRIGTADANSKGWGLGLSLVRGLTVSHGGHVTVESSEENGTSFKVYLPRDCRH